MIKRTIQKRIEEYLFKGKVIILIGARQVGKTTMIKMLQANYSENSTYLNCDEPDIRELLTDVTSTELKRIVGKKKLIFIDEAQRIPNIGLTLKLFVDELPEIQIVATGSSALEISNNLNEPLTGRKFEFRLYPFSMSELNNEFGWLETNRLIDERIIYGNYPEITLAHEDKKTLLHNLIDSYLFKDVLRYKNLRKPEMLEKLLTALAFQISRQVSYSELGKKLGINNETVTSYIDLLEKSFVIFRLPSFGKNLRTELTKSRKVYFYDTGIRNAVISNFKSLKLREDAGPLWENFLISERLKYNSNIGKRIKSYFWRTSQQQEIDYLEEMEGELTAFKIKLNPNVKTKFPVTFLKNYSNSSTEIINKKNYGKFVGI
jgi:predicted AAA+ superfamily ATPase